MTYQGDVYTFIVPVQRVDGTNPTITSAPTLTIVEVATGNPAVTGASMVLLAGTTVYFYRWTIPASATSGAYVGLVNYAVDGNTYTSYYIGHIVVGDSRITGVTALDSTVSKDGTVAKDATVAKAADLAIANPDNSVTVLAIKAKTDALPSVPASQADVNAVSSLCTAARDAALSSYHIDKTVNPQTLTIKRWPDNLILAVFNLTDDSSSTDKTRTA